MAAMAPSEPPGLIFRRLSQADREEILSHFLRLDPEDRRNRFGGPANDDFIRSYCNRIDWSRSIVFGCFVDCVLRGVGELQVESPGPNQKAEITSTVEGPYQGRGVGTELFRRLIEVGRERSIKTLYLTILPDNEKALRTVRKFGAELEVRHGEMKGRVSVSEASRSSRQRND